MGKQPTVRCFNPLFEVSDTRKTNVASKDVVPTPTYMTSKIYILTLSQLLGKCMGDSIVKSGENDTVPSVSQEIHASIYIVQGLSTFRTTAFVAVSLESTSV